MSQSKSIFRNILDAMIESRTRQAKRTLEHFYNSVESYDHHDDKR